MGFTAEWFETASSVIRSPSEHLSNEQRTNGFGYPLAFALFSLILSGMINVVSAVLIGFSGSTSLVNAVASVGTRAITGTAVFIVLALLIHLAVFVFGRRGFGKTFAAVCYGSAVGPLAAFVALLNVVISNLLGLTAISVILDLAIFFIGLYALQIDYRGIQHFHDLSTTKASIAVIWPILLVFVVVAGYMIFAMSMLASLM